MKKTSNKYLYLLKNISLLTISQFATKLLSFFLVPLYTSVLSTSDYGLYSLYSTTVSLLIPIFTIDIVSGVLRFSLSKESNKKNVFTIGLEFIFIGTLISSFLIIINAITNLIPSINEYWYFLIVIFVLTALDEQMIYFARGCEKIKSLAISGFVSAVFVLSLNLLFLLYFKMGLFGYFLAHSIGIASQLICLLIATRFWRFISFKADRKLKKEMIKYSIPFAANRVGWWINDASDKYMVTSICGMSENGIYSVGYKIPTILNVVQSIFNQAWSISAIKEFDTNDSNKFFHNTYIMYVALLSVSSSFLILTDKMLAYFLYAGDFYQAWVYVPFLLISILFGSLSGFFGGVFSALKKTRIFGISTIVGAILNVVLNLLLLSYFGTIGAAIATLISNFIIFFIRLIFAKKYTNINFDCFFTAINIVFLMIQLFVITFVENNIILYSLEGLLFGLLLVVNLLPIIKIWKERKI